MVFPQKTCSAHVIAGSLPWGPLAAGRWTAAGSHLPGEPNWSHRPQYQNSAQSGQRPSGRSLDFHGSEGTLFYPSLEKKQIFAPTITKRYSYQDKHIKSLYAKKFNLTTNSTSALRLTVCFLNEATVRIDAIAALLGLLLTQSQNVL